MRNRDRSLPAAILLFLLVAGGRIEAQSSMEIKSGSERKMIALPGYVPYSVPLPLGAAGRMESARLSSTFSISFNPSSCSGVLADWPDDAKNAFQYAANIWGSTLISTIPISVRACWRKDLSSGVLGQGGPMMVKNFPGAIFQNTYYPMALANALSNSMLYPLDIMVSFNSTFNWYFGTDGLTTSSSYDFASVVLHELGHGLGFLGLMDYTGGLGYWGIDTELVPAVYDHFTKDGSMPLLSYTNYSFPLGTALIGGNILFDGPGANLANAGMPVKLFAPSIWDGGSSYSHLDFSTFRFTANALMVYAMGRGQAIHSPGPVTLGLFKDIGWHVEGSPSLPTTTTSSLASTTTTFPFTTTTTTTTTMAISTTTTTLGGGCLSGSPTQLCLNNRRFRVEVFWRTPDGEQGMGHAIAVPNHTGTLINSGYFWFFGSDNIELTIKILDGRGNNGYFWLFCGAMTDVEYWITATDLQTGAQRQYYNPMYTMLNIRDIKAFQ